MFYEPASGHGLPNNPFGAIVAPRPIGWISTLSSDGVANLAPYSFFNAVAYDPPQVMFAATSSHAFGGLKDTVSNAESTGEFVVNLATYDLREQMNASAVPAPSPIDEFEVSGLTKTASKIVSPPRVGESPAHLECRFVSRVDLPTTDGDPNVVIFGEVVGVHVEDRFIVDGKVDTVALHPIGRLGYLDYVEVNDAFSMERPRWES
ncbi:MAG: flavin reductase [Gemmatimonadetes bacterium]|nr:flavin reductase [Gemmatimonadota bacterium]|tara:strand:+ start:1796 stop:2413 length:618 start_codon:yes stop_codon:yes gene_type:complete